MSKALRSTLIGAAVAVVIVVAVLSPVMWRAARLAFAKASIRRMLGSLTVQEQQNLNATPTLIFLPSPQLNDGSTQIFTIGRYSIQVPKPIAYATISKCLKLTYARFHIIVLPPSDVLEGDSLARQLNFKNYFALEDAAYHSRPADVNAQSDMDALTREQALIEIKLQIVDAALTQCFEEFDRGNLRGFILGPNHNALNSPTIVELSVQDPNVVAGIWFSTNGRVRMPADQIHQFLSVLEVSAEPPKKP